LHEKRNTAHRRISLDVLGLSRRAYSVLRRAGIAFIDELQSYSDEDLLRLTGVGPVTVEEIRRRQRECDLAVAPQDLPEAPRPEQRVVSLFGNRSMLYCGLSKRTANTLCRAGIHTLDELVNVEREELMKIHGFGEVALGEVDKLLKSYDVGTSEVGYLDEAMGSLELAADDCKEEVKSLFERHGIQEWPKDLSWRSFLLVGLGWETIEDLEKSFIELGLPPMEKVPEECIIGHEVLEYLLRVGCPLQKITAGRASATEGNRARLHAAGIRSLLEVCLLREAHLDDLLGDESDGYREDLDWYLQQLPSLDWDAEVCALPPNPVVVWRLQQVAISPLWVDALVGVGIPRRDIDILLARSPCIGSEKPTLEELGNRFGITRERVRQIEARVKRGAREVLRTNEMIETLVLLATRIINEQGLVNRRELTDSMIDMYELQEEGCEVALSQMLCFANDVKYEKLLQAFVSSQIPKGLLLKLHTHLYENLHRAKAPILTGDLVKSLDGLLSVEEREVNDQFQLWRRVLEDSGDFEQVEEKYWGLTKWESRVLDEIVMALREAGKPTHFREITKLANKRLRSDQQTTVRATHAKLAHHHDLFMRTGPGTFGLREWDPDKPIQPMKYRTLINQVLEEAGEPLFLDEIYEKVNARRPAKRSTVTMYLYLHDDFVVQGNGLFGLSAWEEHQNKRAMDQLPDEFRKRLQERAKRAFAKRAEAQDR